MMSYIVQRMACNGCYGYFHCFTVFEWTGENDSNTLRVNTFFFDKLNLKKCSFSNISGYAWRSPKVCKHIPVLAGCLSPSFLVMGVRMQALWSSAINSKNSKPPSPLPPPPKKKLKKKRKKIKRTFL